MAHRCTTIAKAVQPKQSCCHTPGHPVLHIRKPLRSFALGSKLHAQNQRCRCGRSAGNNTITAEQSVSGSAQLARQPQQPAIVLSRNQLANKQVVTRTDGQILGVVDHLLANASTFRVDALSCKPSSDMLAGDEAKQIGLMSLKQISDVLLVHDSRALLQPAEIRTIGLGYIKLVGTVVKTAEGKVIGKVRDFLFSPDDGQISQLTIDALGIPALPERLLGCLGVRIQLVNSISFNCVSLRPGAEVYVDKISPGAFDGAVELLKGYLPFIGSGPSEAEETRDDPEYVEWYLSYGQAYEQMNGQKIARPSQAALQGALAARRMPPQALPPGRQPSYESQLQPQAQPPYQSQLDYQQAEPELAGNYSQQAQQSSAAFQPQPGPYDRQPQPDAWSQQQQWQAMQQQQQQQRPPPYMQAQPQQQQQPQASQQPAFSGQGGSRAPVNAGTPNKVQQQQRFAARADATITEPRFDPRRRKTGMLAPDRRPPASTDIASRGMSQARASAPAASRLSYTPQRSNAAESAQSSGSSQAAWPEAQFRQGGSDQPSSVQASWESEARDGVQSGTTEATQDRKAQPAQQSFDSWADVSPNPVQPLVVMPNGTLDTV